MMLMYIDSDDSENYDVETAGLGVTSHERLLLEAPSSNESRHHQVR